jgi:hypothetical protein
VTLKFDSVLGNDVLGCKLCVNNTDTNGITLATFDGIAGNHIAVASV